MANLNLPESANNTTAQEVLKRLETIETRINGVAVLKIENRIFTTSGSLDKNGLPRIYEIKESKKNPGHHYCTCPSWKFQRGPVSQHWCKHLEAASRQHMIPGAPAEVTKEYGILAPKSSK